MNRRLPALKFAVSVAVAAVALTAVLAAPPAARPAAARRADPTATPPSATTRSGCRVETARGVDAARVGLTDTVAVTLSVRGCVPYRSPRHIALVIDNDLGDAGEARQAKSALFEVVDAFDLPRNPSTEVAVVGFGSAVQLLSALSNDDQRIRGAIRRAGGAAGDAVDRGIDAARRELQRGRRAAADRDSIVQVLIVFSNAAWANGSHGGCGGAISAAGRAKSEGILVIGVATGSRSSAGLLCMRQVATNPRYYFESRQISQLVHIFDAIRTQLDGPDRQPVGLAITDTIAPAFALDPASVRPPAAATSPDGRTLRWALPTTMTHPAAAVTVTYRLRPLALGEWPVSLGASAAFTDARGARGAIAFPPASVEVVDAATADARVCPATRAAVPADVLAAALARPDAVSGWGLRCSPSQPSGPANPPRRSLRLARPGMAYHPVANGLVWSCGCR